MGISKRRVRKEWTASDNALLSLSGVLSLAGSLHSMTAMAYLTEGPLQPQEKPLCAVSSHDAPFSSASNVSNRMGKASTSLKVTDNWHHTETLMRPNRDIHAILRTRKAQRRPAQQALNCQRRPKAIGSWRAEKHFWGIDGSSAASLANTTVNLQA